MRNLTQTSSNSTSRNDTELIFTEIPSKKELGENVIQT